MARSSRLNVCLLTLMANSSQTHCARSINRQRTTPCDDGIGPLSTICEGLALRVIQQRHPAGRQRVDKPIRTGVEPQHPIANRLQTNAAKLCCIATSAALINRGQCEQPTDLVRITAGPRQCPYPRRREIISKRQC
jgi:hypothetical protein